MKRPKSAVSHVQPLEVKSGSAVVKIYPIQNRGRTLYTVTHYPVAGQRRRQNFTDLAEAKAEAYRLAADLQNGEIEVLKLSNKDRSTYLHALAEINRAVYGYDIGSTGVVSLLRPAVSCGGWRSADIEAPAALTGGFRRAAWQPLPAPAGLQRCGSEGI